MYPLHVIGSDWQAKTVKSYTRVQDWATWPLHGAPSGHMTQYCGHLCAWRRHGAAPCWEGSRLGTDTCLLSCLQQNIKDNITMVTVHNSHQGNNSGVVPRWLRRRASTGLKWMVGTGHTNCIGSASMRHAFFLSQPAPWRLIPRTYTPSWNIIYITYSLYCNLHPLL